MNYKDRVAADCAYYGTFCGRWHSNEFWEELGKKLPNMTEDEAKATFERYENEANGAVWQWRQLFC